MAEIGSATSRGSSAVATWLLVVALLLAAQLVPRGYILAEGPPTYGAPDLLTLGLATLAALVLAWMTLPHMAGRTAAASSFSRSGAIVTLAAVGLAWLFIACLAADPQLFYVLVQEDSFAEWGSAVLLLAGAAGLAYALVRWRQPQGSRFVFVLLILYVALLCLIALEEVSWFQRQLDVATPEWIAAANHQGELNLHNFATGLSENLYYLGACVLLVGSRVLHALPRRWWLVEQLMPMMPSQAVFAMGALACSFNWDMWRVVYVELGVMFAVAFTLAELVSALRRGDNGTTILFALLLVTIVGTQLVLLAIGHTMVREWDATEAKELFIALGLAAFATQLAVQRARSAA